MNPEHGIMKEREYRSQVYGGRTNAQALRLSTGTGSVSQWMSEELDNSSHQGSNALHVPMDPESHAAGTQSVCS